MSRVEFHWDGYSPLTAAGYTQIERSDRLIGGGRRRGIVKHTWSNIHRCHAHKAMDQTLVGYSPKDQGVKENDRLRGSLHNCLMTMFFKTTKIQSNMATFVFLWALTFSPIISNGGRPYESSRHKGFWIWGSSVKNMPSGGDFMQNNDSLKQLIGQPFREERSQVTRPVKPQRKQWDTLNKSSVIAPNTWKTQMLNYIFPSTFQHSRQFVG